MKNYTTTANDVAYQSPRTTLERHKITIEEDGNHSHHTWDVVRVKDAVAAVVTNDKGNFLLVENFRYAVGETFPELCAGLIEPGENPEIAVLREIEEELGKRARHLKPIGTFYSSPGLLTEKIHVYWAMDLEDCPQRLESGEDLKVVELTPREVWTMLNTPGAIKDMKTQMALLTARRLICGEDNVA